MMKSKIQLLILPLVVIAGAAFGTLGAQAFDILGASSKRHADSALAISGTEKPDQAQPSEVIVQPTEAENRKRVFSTDNAEPAEDIHQRHAQRIRSHEMEALDPAWGPATANVLRKDLNRIATLSEVQVHKVDCRTSTCTALIEWKSRGTAVSDFRYFLEVPMQINCVQTIVLPEPSAGEKSVLATLFLDCESWRAEGSPMIREDQLPLLPSRRELSR